jgi:hypothetical protein
MKEAMSRTRTIAVLIGAAASLGCEPTISDATPVVHGANHFIDDSLLIISGAAEVTHKRNALIAYVWGRSGWPSHVRPTVERDLPSPVSGLGGVARIDKLTVLVNANAGPVESWGYHFIPAQPTGRLVILHHGHACDLDDSPAPIDEGLGMQRTINALVGHGVGVLAMYMPRFRPGQCDTHTKLFVDRLGDNGEPFRYFLEPLVANLGYLRSESARDGFPAYGAFGMVGLSGGGWTTTVYAALDPTIDISIEVAGSMPLYLRGADASIDIEQFDEPFYGQVGYEDLYVLGAHGPGRRRIQVLNRHDDCCFGEAQLRTDLGLSFDAAVRGYEAQVQRSLAAMGESSFQVEIDESSPGHMISWETIEGIILPALAPAE